MTQRLKEEFKGSINPEAGSLKTNKKDKPLTTLIKKKKKQKKNTKNREDSNK